MSCGLTCNLYATDESVLFTSFDYCMWIIRSYFCTYSSENVQRTAFFHWKFNFRVETRNGTSMKSRQKHILCFNSYRICAMFSFFANMEMATKLLHKLEQYIISVYSNVMDLCVTFTNSSHILYLFFIIKAWFMNRSTCYIRNNGIGRHTI